MTRVASRSMSGDEDPSPIDWEHVGRLELHPRRFGVLQILALDGGRTLSPSECAYELHTNTGDVSYHMRVLGGSGVVRLAHTIPVRGTREHFYCLADHSADDLFERLNLPRDDQ